MVILKMTIMKKIPVLFVAVLLLISCGSGTGNDSGKGGPAYITDSLASQVNTHIPDSNKKEPDSIK
jgi:hypothetical protein